MKKIVSLLLVFILLFSFIGCSQSPEEYMDRYSSTAITAMQDVVDKIGSFFSGSETITYDGILEELKVIASQPPEKELDEQLYQTINDAVDSAQKNLMKIGQENLSTEESNKYGDAYHQTLIDLRKEMKTELKACGFSVNEVSDEEIKEAKISVVDTFDSYVSETISREVALESLSDDLAIIAESDHMEDIRTVNMYCVLFTMLDLGIYDDVEDFIELYETAKQANPDMFNF